MAYTVSHEGLSTSLGLFLSLRGRISFGAIANALGKTEMIELFLLTVPSKYTIGSYSYISASNVYSVKMISHTIIVQ